MTTVAKQRLIEGSIVTLIVIGLYFAAQKYHLYYIFRYFDWAQHFLGGVGIGLLSTAFFGRSIKWSIGIVTAIAVGWEIFERVGHIYLPQYINYGGFFDTSIDILCAIIGVSLVLLMTRE